MRDGEFLVQRRTYNLIKDCCVESGDTDHEVKLEDFGGRFGATTPVLLKIGFCDIVKVKFALEEVFL
jgi:hypothetical protein